MKELEEYSKELGLGKALTLSEFIDSHRRMRSNQVLENDKWRQELKESLERAKEYARTHPSEYISFESLRNMTIKQLADLVSE